jgi:hypothetical protein
VQTHCFFCFPRVVAGALAAARLCARRGNVLGALPIPLASSALRSSLALFFLCCYLLTAVTSQIFISCREVVYLLDTVDWATAVAPKGDGKVVVGGNEVKLTYSHKRPNILTFSFEGLERFNVAGVRVWTSVKPFKGRGNKAPRLEADAEGAGAAGAGAAPVLSDVNDGLAYIQSLLAANAATAAAEGAHN